MLNLNSISLEYWPFTYRMNVSMPSEEYHTSKLIASDLRGADEAVTCIVAQEALAMTGALETL